MSHHEREREQEDVLIALVLLDGHRIACNARTQGDRRTDRETDKPQDRHPRCVCALRVNNKINTSGHHNPITRSYLPTPTSLWLQ